MTVNHDVTGSSPVRGAKNKTHPIGWVLFLLFRAKFARDVMINFPSAYRLSVAKLVVDEKKQPEWLFFDVKGTKQGVSEVSLRTTETTMRLPCRPHYVRTSLGV